MANGEVSAGAGLCPPVADGAPTLQLAGPGDQGEDALRGREGSQLGGVTPNLPAFTSLQDLHQWGSEAVPASVSPSTSGMPVMQSAASAEPVPELCGAEPPSKASPVRGVTRRLLPGTGGYGDSCPAVPWHGNQPAYEWRPGPFSLSRAASSSLLNHV